MMQGKATSHIYLSNPNAKFQIYFNYILYSSVTQNISTGDAKHRGKMHCARAVFYFLSMLPY